ncbi:hypothetical protein [Mesobacillus selenatarsenatis]|uniref:Uncharacterized protein n=1 Tax=Mesobacillus selenatarsenatis TaxID=388741 RepID=A0A846TJN4_9BACI|nr:hypothetical protein [Mesobacillus selenatarsenatis]NKE06989.1 hypothetical protein [Mesobacillus selenatarsenatis]
MHFRHLLITGFIAGAAMLVPDMAFAEKGENPGKGPQPVPAEQANVPDKANNVRIPEKSPAQPAIQNRAAQKQGVQNPAQAKPEETPADAGKVKGNASSSKKEQKAAQPKKTKASTTEKPNQVNHKQKHSNNQNKKGALKSIHNKDQYAKETERRSPILEEKVEPPKEYKTPSNVKKEAKTEIRKMPSAKKDENDSSQKERYPKGDNLPNPPSRTKASGGPSGDRTSYGNTNNFLSDKWFYWDVTFQLNLLQHFTSRVAVFQSQWVNAPPSPPPLKAPAFLPYTDAIVTDHVNEKGANDENEK